MNIYERKIKCLLELIWQDQLLNLSRVQGDKGTQQYKIYFIDSRLTLNGNGRKAANV